MPKVLTSITLSQVAKIIGIIPFPPALS